MQATSVGIRDAKIHLSRYLKMVQQGIEIILTDRGRPVGKIVPIQNDKLPLDERIKLLEDRGLLAAEKRKDRKKPPLPIAVPDNVAQKYLREDREGD